MLESKRQAQKSGEFFVPHFKAAGWFFCWGKENNCETKKIDTKSTAVVEK